MDRNCTIDFDSQLRKHYTKVVAYGRALTQSNDDAEDIAQETFLKAYSGYGSYHGDCGFEPWVMRIALNFFLDMRRQRNRRTPTVSTTDLGFDAGTDASTDYQATVEASDPESCALEVELGRTPKQDRVLLGMALASQLSVAEIAKRTRKSPRAVRMDLNRISADLTRRTIRRRLQSRLELS